MLLGMLCFNMTRFSLLWFFFFVVVFGCCLFVGGLLCDFRVVRLYLFVLLIGV